MPWPGVASAANWRASERDIHSAKLTASPSDTTPMIANLVSESCSGPYSVASGTLMATAQPQLPTGLMAVVTGMPSVVIRLNTLRRFSREAAASASDAALPTNCSAPSERVTTMPEASSVLAIQSSGRSCSRTVWASVSASRMSRRQ